MVHVGAGSCAYQPSPGIRLREVGHGDDMEMRQAVMSVDFRNEEVDFAEDDVDGDLRSRDAAQSHPLH